MMKRVKRGILRMLHRAAVSVEDAVDIGRRRLARKTGRHQPRQIAAYAGFADSAGVHLTGRVLANRPRGGPLDTDGGWPNLVNTFRRWESDEVAGATVTLSFGNREQVVLSDDEGYYAATFPALEKNGAGLAWRIAVARTAGAEGEVRAEHGVLVPPRDAAFGIISDLDDTVIHTGITSLLLAAKLTFLENARTRKPLEGVAELYQALQLGHESQPTNPIFYISSSPWNLHDLLEDFLRLNGIPRGPMLLRDVGLDRTKFIKSKGHGHKLDKALRLIDAYPDLPFVLIGDSGQEDPTIYAETTCRRPGRISAIYIRDIDPETDSSQDPVLREAREVAAKSGVPMVVARDSRAIAGHAIGLGLLPERAIHDIMVEVEADKSRLEAGKQALEDAVGTGDAD